MKKWSILSDLHRCIWPERKQLPWGCSTSSGPIAAYYARSHVTINKIGTSVRHILEPHSTDSYSVLIIVRRRKKKQSCSFPFPPLSSSSCVSARARLEWVRRTRLPTSVVGVLNSRSDPFTERTLSIVHSYHSYHGGNFFSTILLSGTSPVVLLSRRTDVCASCPMAVPTSFIMDERAALPFFILLDTVSFFGSILFLNK